MAGLAFRCRCLKRQKLIENPQTQKYVEKLLIRNNIGVLTWNSITQIDDISKLFPVFKFERFEKKIEK